MFISNSVQNCNLGVLIFYLVASFVHIDCTICVMKNWILSLVLVFGSDSNLVHKIKQHNRCNFWSIERVLHVRISTSALLISSHGTYTFTFVLAFGTIRITVGLHFVW